MDDSDSRYFAQRFALSRALALAGITTTLSIPLAFYARATAPDPDLVPLIDASGRAYYLAAIIVTILICGLIQALETDDPARIVNRYGERLYRYRQPVPRTAWMLPGVALFSIYLMLAMHHRAIFVVLMPLVAGGVVLVARVLRYEVVSRPPGSGELIVVAQQALVYGTAAGAFLVVFAFRARTLFSGPLLFLLAWLLLMALFDGTRSVAYRRYVHAAIGALATAQLAWALGYWNVSTLSGGALLALVFAVFGGLSRLEFSGGVTRQQVLSLVGGALPVFILIAYLVE